MTHARHLSDSALTAEVIRLAGREREATVALIVHLAEFDARRLYEGAGYPSLFQYCLAVLRLSEDAVYNRIEVARAARRYPGILDMLLSGALSPTTVRLLARHLTSENHRELLAAASGMGKQQVEKLLACRFPQPDVAASVRAIRSRPATAENEAAVRPLPGPPVSSEIHPPTSGTPATPPAGVSAAAASQVEASAAAVAPSGPNVAPAPRSLVRPLAPERYEIRFTASAEMREKLRLAQDLLSHAVPSGDIAQVFDRALTLLVHDLQRRKFATTPKPRPARPPRRRSRYVPAAVKRAVWVRDGGRCTLIASSGRRCDATRLLEYDHRDPYAVGGEATVDRTRLLCRSHNGYEVDRFFGPGKRRTRGDGAARSPAVHGTPTERATRPGTTPAIEGSGSEKSP